jgi:hypothetical protein
MNLAHDPATFVIPHWTVYFRQSQRHLDATLLCVRLVLASAPLGCGRLSEETSDVGEKTSPGRLTFQQNVVPAFERHEASARNETGQLAPSREGYPAIFTRVEHQRGRGHLARQVAHVDLVERVQKFNRILG